MPPKVCLKPWAAKPAGHYLPTKQDNSNTVQSFYDNGYLPDESLPYLDTIDHGKDFPKDY